MAFYGSIPMIARITSYPLQHIFPRLFSLIFPTARREGTPPWGMHEIKNFRIQYEQQCVYYIQATEVFVLLRESYEIICISSFAFFSWFTQGYVNSVFSQICIHLRIVAIFSLHILYTKNLVKVWNFRTKICWKLAHNQIIKMSPTYK